MSIKSTYSIERETAIRVVLSKVYSMTNDELSDMLESFKESTFRNYSVYDKLDEQEDNDRVIKEVSEFDWK